MDQNKNIELYTPYISPWVYLRPNHLAVVEDGFCLYCGSPKEGFKGCEPITELVPKLEVKTIGVNLKYNTKKKTYECNDLQKAQVVVQHEVTKRYAFICKDCVRKLAKKI